MPKQPTAKKSTVFRYFMSILLLKWDCSWLWFALFSQHATDTMDSHVRGSGGKCQLLKPCQAMVGWSQLGIGCGSPHSMMLGNGQWTWQAVLLLPVLPEYSQHQVCHFKRRERRFIKSMENGGLLCLCNSLQISQIICCQNFEIWYKIILNSDCQNIIFKEMTMHHNFNMVGFLQQRKRKYCVWA